MPHYFSEDANTLKSNPKEIAFRVYDADFTCITDHGVFAKDGLDRGTEVLLKYLDIEDTVQSVLDFGCGYGPIGIVVAKTYDVRVDMIDINPRAVELARQNVKRNRVSATVLLGDGFASLENTYDLIVTNPPIRIGKEHLYSLLAEAKNHLNEGGRLTFVINKKHGAESALRFVQTVYQTVEIVGKQKGFWVINCN